MALGATTATDGARHDLGLSVCAYAGAYGLILADTVGVTYASRSIHSYPFVRAYGTRARPGRAPGGNYRCSTV
jgi:hypothetical protein